MSIEIKQLIIKSTLVSERSEEAKPELNKDDIETLKREVMEECRELFEHSLSEKQER